MPYTVDTTAAANRAGVPPVVAGAPTEMDHACERLPDRPMTVFPKSFECQRPFGADTQNSPAVPRVFTAIAFAEVAEPRRLIFVNEAPPLLET